MTMQDVNVLQHSSSGQGMDVIEDGILDSKAIPDCLDDELNMCSDGLTGSLSASNMKCEMQRRRTFREYPTLGLACFLARNGFYMSGADRHVHCAFCGLEIPTFPSSSSGPMHISQDIVLKHWTRARQYCPFLLGQDVGNVTGTCSSLNMGHHSEWRLNELATTWPGSEGEEEMRRLIKKVTLSGVIPSSSHHLNTTAFSPMAANTAAKTTRKRGSDLMNHNLPTSFPRPTPPRTTTSSPGPSSEHQPISPPRRSSPSTWADMVRTARYPQMAAYKDRLDTLKRWPLVTLSATELAKAGLFHVMCNGHCSASDGTTEGVHPFLQSQTHSNKQCTDSVKCFWCGERFNHWKPSDDAMLEHARLSPRCRYVIQVLGPQLHNDVIANSRLNVNNECSWNEERNHTASHLQLWTSGSTIVAAPNHHVKFMDDDVILIMPFDNNIITKQIRRANFVDVKSGSQSLDNIMRSQTVEQVLQMGFPPDVMKNILGYSSRRHCGKYI